MRDLAGMTRFWAGALAREPVRGTEEPWTAFDVAPGVLLVLVPAGPSPSGEGPPPPAPAPVPGRLRLGLTPVGDGQEEEVRRLLRLGARPVPGAAAPRREVMLTDPEGNVLVVLRA